MIVDQYGRVKTEKPLFVEEVIVSSLSITPVNTIFRRFGHMLPLLCIVLTTIIMAASHFTAYRK
jgi:apolipoprotein N-acyltransferase